MKIGAVVMAAGASARLGEPKQLVQYQGEPLLARTARIALEAGCASISVVLGAHGRRILAGCPLPGASIVHNAGWAAGMSTSIHCGIASLSTDTDGVILLACDQPALTTDHLRSLVTDGAAASFYAGRRAVPAYFPQEWFIQLSSLTGDKGARDLLASADVREVPFPLGELDIDTPADLARLRSLDEG